MNARQLIKNGEIHLLKYSVALPAYGMLDMFPSGARWMNSRLNELDADRNKPFDAHIPYRFYGCLKYGICVAGAAACGIWFSRYGIGYLVLPVFVFYLLEAQFLFLFPLLTDGAPAPVRMGMAMIFRIGVIRCIFTVIPIAVYMLFGLLRRKEPLRNWYVGCMAILIWYHHETGNGI